MSSFVALVRADVRLQVRYGLYGVSLLMVLIWGTVLGGLGASALSPSVLVPPFIAVNLIITTFYFIAALVLFEKNEGVLSALVVTPVSALDYLLSKVLSLTGLAAAETLLIVAFIFGSEVEWPLLLAGTCLLAALYSLVGFLVIVRLRTFNDFLMPSVFFVIVLLLPLLEYLPMSGTGMLWLHPAYPALALIRGAVGSAAAGLTELMAAIGWCSLALLWSSLEFRRHFVRGR